MKCDYCKRDVINPTLGRYVYQNKNFCSWLCLTEYKILHNGESVKEEET